VQHGGGVQQLGDSLFLGDQSRGNAAPAQSVPPRPAAVEVDDGTTGPVQRVRLPGCAADLYRGSGSPGIRQPCIPAVDRSTKRHLGSVAGLLGSTRLPLAWLHTQPRRSSARNPPEQRLFNGIDREVHRSSRRSDAAATADFPVPGNPDTTMSTTPCSPSAPTTQSCPLALCCTVLQHYRALMPHSGSTGFAAQRLYRLPRCVRERGSGRPRRLPPAGRWTAPMLPLSASLAFARQQWPDRHYLTKVRL
jgi:hypothetical protein